MENTEHRKVKLSVAEEKEFYLLNRFIFAALPLNKSDFIALCAVDLRGRREGGGEISCGGEFLWRGFSGGQGLHSSSELRNFRKCFEKEVNC